jgi:hypothetical protein
MTVLLLILLNRTEVKGLQFETLCESQSYKSKIYSSFSISKMFGFLLPSTRDELASQSLSTIFVYGFSELNDFPATYSCLTLFIKVIIL